MAETTGTEATSDRDWVVILDDGIKVRYGISTGSQDPYPKNDLYQFQEFAGPVFELGGYGDMSLIDPYTMRRLWVSDVLREEEREGPAYLLNAIRRVLDVAETVGFFAEDDD